MFVDIRDSSKIVEALSPELTVEFLNIYLGLAAQSIVANHGGVNQFIGDGVLATFGLLDEADHGASNALAAAAAIHHAFEDAKGRIGSPNPVRAVVAIHTGTGILHAVGRAESSHFGVLGAAVNIASRLEWEGKELGLTTVLSGSTVAALNRPAGSIRLVTRKKLRGLSDRVEIWSPDALEPADSGDHINPTARNRPALAGALDWRPLASGILLAGIFVASLLALIGLRLGDETFLDSLLNAAQILAAAAASMTCGLVALRSKRHLRRGWGLIALSSAAWGVGQSESTLLGLGLGLAPMSAWFADISFLASLGLAIAGVASFWSSRLGPSDRWRAILDWLIVSSALLFAAWALGLREIWLGPATTRSASTAYLVFPAGEIVLGTVVILVINRGARHLQGPLLILLSSVVVSATAAVFGAYEINDLGPAGDLADAGMLLALLLLALAPLWPVREAAQPADGNVDMWQHALPWSAVMLASVSGIAVLLHGEGLDRFLTLLAAMLGAFLAGSQFLAHRESVVMLVKTRLSEKTLADAIAHAPIGIARANTDYKIVAANPSLGVLLREPPEVIAGSPIGKYFPAEVQQQVRESLQALASGETDTVESEVPMIRADGNRAWIHLTATVVKKPTGQVDYFLAMVQDGTARHEAEQASRTTLAELERLNHLKTEFLRSISHEFRTALIGIEGFSELMRDSTVIDADEVREFARDIHSGAEQLSRMVTEFLDIDQVGNGPATMLLGSVDVNAVIRSEVEQAMLGTDGLTFTARLDPSLPVIVGDEAKVLQLMRLLLGNAVKHSPDGGQVIVSTRVHAGQLEVSVTDQGVGVREDFDNPLFSGEDLYAKNPIRRVVGTGLGLGIARQIVSLHGGRVWMDRLDGVGYESHVTFPLDMTARTGDAAWQAAGANAS